MARSTQGANVAARRGPAELTPPVAVPVAAAEFDPGSGHDADRLGGPVPSGFDRDEGARVLAFAEFAESLAVAAHTADVADAVRTHLARSLGASFANLALVEPGSRSVRIQHPVDLDAAIVERYTALALDARTPLTDAIRSRETVIVEDPEAYARRYPAMADDTRAAGLASTASIPLISGGVVCGAIGVGWAHAMKGDDSFIGRLHAVARLTAETLARTQTSDTHAALITALQERMVPTVATGPGLDISVRYQAAGAGLGFGGDWYDVIALDDVRTTVVVGDVVGHGIEAAATMVVVRSALNAVVQLGTPLADILGVAGRVVEGPVNAYIGTAVVLVVDTEAQRIGYSSAGHPPVLVVYRDGETRFLEDSRGPVLGIRDRVPAAGSVPFPPDAIAIAYTDGLIETRRGTLDGGLARLRAAALEGLRAGHEAQAISEHIMASIVDLAHLEDDIALVVLRNTGSA